MIKVVAKSVIVKDKVNDALQLCQALIEETLKEKGCIDYALYQDRHDESILTMIEEWASEEDLDKHLKSEHFTRIVPRFGELLAKETEMNIYNKLM